MSRPNILFVLADQWRGDCLSVTGHPVVETPNLDMVAKKGVVFTSAYSSCPSCIAARASLWTGLTPNRTGRLGYRDQVPWRYDDMLAELVGRSGYQTHCVGKTHYFPQRSHLGFDSLESYEGLQNFTGRYVNDYHEWLRDQSGGAYEEIDSGLSHNSWVARPSHLPEELHNNTWVATRSIEFLKRKDPNRPFFLNMSFHRPHPPIDPPAVYWNEYRDRPLPEVPVGDWAEQHAVDMDDVNGWHGIIAHRALDQTRRAYFAQIAHIDNQIGRVIDFIGRQRLGPTAVIFTADHGEMLGDHHMYRKSYAYEGSARIPLIVMTPDGSANGRCEAPAVIEDLYPTILEIAGVQVPERTEGVSLLPALAPKPDSSETLFSREFVHGEHSSCYDEANAMQFLTDGKEKYVWFPVSGKEQLFDLEHDPDERHDLAAGASADESNTRPRIERWRSRLIARLAERPQDGMSDGSSLIPGKSPPAVRPELIEGA